MIERCEYPEATGDAMDAEEDRLRRSLLIFACALMNFSVMLWLAIYWYMGLNFSTNFPLAYQLFSISLAFSLQLSEFFHLFLLLTMQLIVLFRLQFLVYLAHQHKAQFDNFY